MAGDGIADADASEVESSGFCLENRDTIATASIRHNQQEAQSPSVFHWH
jgi:hypothetical protein